MAALLLTLMGGALRVWELPVKTLWLDEAFSLWLATQAPGELIGWVMSIDHHPPLYYLLLHIWQSWLGDSAAAARTMSALAGTVAIPVFYVAAHRLAGPSPALGAMVLVALSPLLVRFSQEARMYSLLTLAVAATLAAAAWLLTNPRPTSLRVLPMVLALGTAQAAAMWLHNTATVLVPVSLNLGVLGSWLAWRRGYLPQPWPFQENRGWWRRWLAAQVLAIALWLPWSNAFLFQVRAVDAHFWIDEPTVNTVLDTIGNLTFAHLPEALPLRAWWPLLGLWLAWRGVRAPATYPGLPWLLLSLSLAPLIAELAVSLRRPILYDRTLIWTILPYALLMARGALPARPDTLRRPALLAGGAVVLFCALGTSTYLLAYEKEAWDEAAAVVKAKTEADDLILFHASWVQLPFDYYFGADDDELGTPLTRHGLPADLFDRGELEPSMTLADLPRLDELIDGRDRVWLIYSHWWYTDPDGIIPAALADRLHLTQEWSWVGLRVLLYMGR